MTSKTLIFDGQILQTPALKRGMGQYVAALLTQLDKVAKKEKLDLRLVLSSEYQLEPDHKTLLKRWENIEVTKLPLVRSETVRRTAKAIDQNRSALDAWIKRESLQGATFLAGSLFQSEIFAALPSETRNMVIAYDAIPLQFFHDYRQKMRWTDYLTRFRELYRADKVLCISKTTANDMQVYANVPGTKIAVINGGPGPVHEQREPAIKPDTQFILMPTGNDVRKNNKTAIAGFEHFRLSYPHDVSLVVTSVFSDEERQELQQLSPNVIFTGPVADEELAWYYQHCEALLFASLYEGLGMPIIEAMLFNKPVVASGIDVFTEISADLPYYFNPVDPFSIADALGEAFNAFDFSARQARYDSVTKAYTWEATAKAVLQNMKQLPEPVANKPKPKLAVVGPYSFGVSAIGKFMASLHPTLQEQFEVDYYFEASPIDKELRPDILSHVAPCYSIRALSDERLASYDLVMYHVGNSNHHTVTVSRALLRPGIVVLHDLNIENVYKDLVDRHMIDFRRLELEEALNEGSEAKFLYSLVSRQYGVITHSAYAQDVIKRLIASGGRTSHVAHAQLSIDTPLYYEHPPQGQFTIGLAGILAGIKGLETIEHIARQEDFTYDKILLFGLNFAEQGVLERLRELPNVEIATDLSDYEFQQNLKRMSVFVNYRAAYQGEASYSTLESMRYGVPVFVRADFGWYSELPDNAVVKVDSADEIVAKIRHLKQDQNLLMTIGENAAKATANVYSHDQYTDAIAELYRRIHKGQA